ncbi:hypothetical protein BDV18DRAFT_164610 [Aspergillus unguis]
MTTPPSKQYTSSELIESSGAIFSNLSTSPKTVCLLYYQTKNEWLLAKGRRNIDESRQDAALRELREETGYSARLVPVRMYTRAPPAPYSQVDGTGHVPDVPDVPDVPRLHDALTEPFMLSVRPLSGGVKIIWWYIAALDERVDSGVQSAGEEQFSSEFVPFDEALERLSYQGDREVLERAMELVQ